MTTPVFQPNGQALCCCAIRYSWYLCLARTLDLASTLMRRWQ